MKKLLISIVAVAFASFSVPALADIYCAEHVTGVIAHSNGNVYFTTDGTCAGWCQTSNTSAAQANQLLVLIQAQTLSKTVFFDWPNISNCTTANATYAVPGFMTITP